MKPSQNPMYRRPNRTKGFTLIELMVVIAVVAVLATIAYNSYQDSVRKGKRAEGKGALTEVAQGLEKCKTLYGSYNNANCAIAGQVSGGNTLNSTEGFYAVSTTALTATTFTLQAVPQQADPRCGTLTLDQAGTRTSSGTAPVDECW